MNSLDNATLETNASDIYGKGVDSRHSLPVRGARDALTGLDLVHLLSTSFKTVDMELLWRFAQCDKMAIHDMALIIRWHPGNVKVTKASWRTYTSDEFFQAY